MLYNKKAFTLIELLIVVAILGILATVAYVSLSVIKDKARDAMRISALMQVREALEIYYSNHGYYPYFVNGAYADDDDWRDPEIVDNWGDFLDTIDAEGLLAGDKKTHNIVVNGTTQEVNITLQDPLFDPADTATYFHTYQYMPSITPVEGKPNNFRLRVKLEDLSNKVLAASLTGQFLYDEDYDARYPEFFCSPDIGYYCVGPESDFTAFESGKPVIYLYPTEKTEVSVKIDKQRITESIPEYGDGWQVTAYPDGTIKLPNDNQDYPYLFWEGIAAQPYVNRSEGFVVAREDIENFLADQLSAQGLLVKEYEEFIDFWAPKMKDKEYVYVYFMPQNDYDRFVEMTINPQPGTIIRVYMVFKSLDEPITVQKQIFAAPERKGFTVVEWGGGLSQLK